ncbi:putative Zinc finger, SWIM-type [Helianthus annuus]|nr:putative Zinc finger, SWIM-type [Helianthus annuus]
MYDWLNEIPFTAWSRAYFSGRAKCDMLLNNICEVFNRQIVGARDKPIITCLEFIREYMTKRIVNVNKMQAKCTGPLTPHATEVFDEIKKQAAEMSVLMVDSDKYQVTGLRSQCVVNVKHKTCACRKWDLTGMPCKHAVATIWDMSRNNIDAGIPEEWVDDVYWLSTWKKVYQNVIEPIIRPEMWTPSECPTTLIPPKHHTQVGRPSGILA